jgi:hypothetical protein
MIKGFKDFGSADDFPGEDSGFQAKHFSLFKTNILKYKGK